MTNSNKQNPDYYKQVASSDFDVAVRRGFWRSVMSWFKKADNKLLPFDEIRRYLPVHGQHYAGLREIPIDKIVGSVARYNDFDRAFIPRQRHTKSRWVSIDMANLQDVILPAIEVYKIGEMYFVKDGNHRVSVAREKGQAYIDAHITEIVPQHPITNMDNIFDLILEQERLNFHAKTSIDAIRPGSGIELTIPGQYEKLLEHISVHRWFMGERKQGEVSESDAVAGWYDEVYLPLAKLIQDQNILKDFPDRTVTDLYLWIIEHLWFLREQYHEEVSLEDAADHFKREFTKKPLSRISNMFQKLTDFMADPQSFESGETQGESREEGGENPPTEDPPENPTKPDSGSSI